MRLNELDPRWLIVEGARVGFVFRSPTNQRQWQSCFINPPSIGEQIELFEAQVGENEIVQPCNPEMHWSCAGGFDGAFFESLTIKPSLDGSAGGLWHGCITNGEIVGGI